MNWKLPPPSTLKFNFDASFKDDICVIGCVLRDSDRVLRGAWSDHLVLDNPFCAETEAVFQALTIASSFGNVNIIFEGDASEGKSYKRK